MFTTVQTKITGTPVVPKHIQEITCYKEAGRWYISLAKLVTAKGRQAGTEIAAFTDDLLGWLARRRNRFTLLLHTLPFEGARVLELEELCTGKEGGAYYRLFSGSAAGRLRLWVCDTSLLVFGDLPPWIFVKIGSAAK